MPCKAAADTPPAVLAVLPPKWGELQAAEAAVDGGDDGGADGVVAAGGAEDGVEVQEAEEDRTHDASEEGEEEEAEAEEEEEAEGPSSLASLLFYGVRGRQMREGEAPSWFNPVEASTGAVCV